MAEIREFTAEDPKVARESLAFKRSSRSSGEEVDQLLLLNS